MHNQLEALVTKPAELRLVPSTHSRRELTVLTYSLTSTRVLWSEEHRNTSAHLSAHTRTQNVIKCFSKEFK